MFVSSRGDYTDAKVIQRATTSMLSLTALARIAEREVRDWGPLDVDQVIDHLTVAAGMDTERAEAGLRLAVIGRRLELDRDATLRMPDLG